jgi:starch phosphorylase
VEQGYVEQYIDKDGKIVDAFYNNEYGFLQDTGVKVNVRIRKGMFGVRYGK